jgi:large subunit ribosomal protein L24
VPELALQTTLLGLAIAIILALVTALVGPLFIDWGNHRSVFEAEASRLIGVNVRVAGAIEARLLPSPRLKLHDIAIGEGRDTIRARSLGVEFALGPLMRGEWRAAEMHLAGPQLSLGLDAAGRVRAPSLAVAFNPDELSVDRLSIDDGTIMLTDAASGANTILSDVRFNGEARSLVGPVKGEGAVTLAGQPYSYRIAVRRLGEEGELKLHLNVDSVNRPLGIEADGTLGFAANEPRFDGSWTLSRAVGIGRRPVASAPALTQPWRMSGKIKATGRSALMENVDFHYGSEEQGFSLTGIADFKFGTNPRLDGIVSGRQIDLDRALSETGDAARQAPATVIRKLAELGAAAFRTTLPVQIGVGIDQVTLGSGTVQNLRGDISSTTDGWTLDRFEFRAPGMTQVRMSGRVAVGADGVRFSGPAEVDASDPKVLAAWFEGRSDTPQSELRPLTMRGDLILAGDKVAVEGLKLEFDRRPVTGRFAYVYPSGTQAAKLDAEVNAADLDIDAGLAFGKALLAGSAIERPHDMSVAADIGRATFAGIEARDVHARVKVDAGGLQLDQLSLGDVAGSSFAASGRLRTAGHAPRGTLTMDFQTKRPAAIAGVVKRFVPARAEQFLGLFERFARGKLHAVLDVAGDDKSPVSGAQLSIRGDLDALTMNVSASATGDWNKPSAADVRLEVTIDAPQGAMMTKMMNMDGIVAVGPAPAQLRMQLAGSAQGDMTFETRLTAEGLSGRASGKGRLSGDHGADISATVQVVNADLAPLRPATGSGGPLPLRMTTRVVVTGNAIKFDDVDATLDGSSIHGHLALSGDSPRRIVGTIEANAANVPALLGREVGLRPQAVDRRTAWKWSSEPFGVAALGNLAGQVSLKFASVQMLPEVTASDVKVTLRLGKEELALEDATGDLAGGRMSGRISFRRGEDGLTAQARISVSRADITRLSRAVRPPVSGLLDLTADVEGTGLSPVALVGSLKGSAKIKLADGQIAGLDPHIFDAVNSAVDQGLNIDNGRISDFVNKSLEKGQLSLVRAESAMEAIAGQIRFKDVSVDSKDAALSAAGTFDLTDGSINVRLALSGSGEAAGARPTILLALQGPFTAPTRSVDVSALTGWLTLRAVENQTKRLHAIENPPAQTRGRGMPKNKQAPALPAPIDIRPVPAPRSAGQPDPSVRSQN